MDSIFSKTDKLFWEKFPELKCRKINGSIQDEEYRKAWMDIYISVGGRYFILGENRIASVSEKKFSKNELELFKKVDKTLWDEFPEITNKKVDLKSKDSVYRKFWMDKYIEFGGNYFQIGKLRIATPK